jgi:hypothetical protein
MIRCQLTTDLSSAEWGARPVDLSFWGENLMINLEIAKPDGRKTHFTNP